MKKFLVMAIVAAMLTATLSGCTQSGANEETTTEATTTVAEETTAEDTTAEDSGEATDDTTASDDAAADSKSVEILNAIKEVYGADYVPNMPIDGETLNMLLNITSDQYVSFAAEMPMISAHVDTVIIIEAADGQADAVDCYRPFLYGHISFGYHIAVDFVAEFIVMAAIGFFDTVTHCGAIDMALHYVTV